MCTNIDAIRNRSMKHLIYMKGSDAKGSQSQSDISQIDL